jgi:hypothetical protein
MPGVSLGLNNCYEGKINNCCTANTRNFLCGRIGQTVFCTLNGIDCGGIVGKTNITSKNTISTFGYCPNLDKSVSDLVKIAPEHGYAKLNCTISNPCPLLPLTEKGLSCYWDNDG